MLILQNSVFYTAQFRLAIFRVLNSQVWLMAIILDGVILDYKQVNKNGIYNKYIYK